MVTEDHTGMLGYCGHSDREGGYVFSHDDARLAVRSTQHVGVVNTTKIIPHDDRLSVDSGIGELSGEPAGIVLVKQKFEHVLGTPESLAPFPRCEGLVLCRVVPADQIIDLVAVVRPVGQRGFDLASRDPDRISDRIRRPLVRFMR